MPFRTIKLKVNFADEKAYSDFIEEIDPALYESKNIMGYEMRDNLKGGRRLIKGGRTPWVAK